MRALTISTTAAACRIAAVSATHSHNPTTSFFITTTPSSIRKIISSQTTIISSLPTLLQRRRYTSYRTKKNNSSNSNKIISSHSYYNHGRRLSHTRIRQQHTDSHPTSNNNNNIDNNNDDDDDDDTKPKLFPLQLPSPSIDSSILSWVKNSVIGLNLCPFAEKPLKHDLLSIHQIRGSDETIISTHVLYHMERLSSDDSRPGETCLVVAPDFFPDDFESFCDFTAFLEDFVAKDLKQLTGKVQLATFHPHFVFEGTTTSETDVENLTNRSPYPIFHVLREEDVSAAVDVLGGDAGRVWKRNVALVKMMSECLGGEGEVERVMRGEVGEGELERVRGLLREMMAKDDGDGDDEK